MKTSELAEVHFAMAELAIAENNIHLATREVMDTSVRAAEAERRLESALRTRDEKYKATAEAMERMAVK